VGGIEIKIGISLNILSYIINLYDVQN
jgi:hypothetical protein